MSLVGFKADNHPQQTGKRGANDATDDRGTEWQFIRDLEERFGFPFDMDVAAAPHNAKAPKFYTREDDGLSQPWRGFVWCNPPYSDIAPWIRKAWNAWHGPYSGPSITDPDMRIPGPNMRIDADGHALSHQRDLAPWRIVMLLPANRVEQAWWQDLVEPFRDRPNSPLRVEFLRGRMRFDRPDWTPGPKGDRPPFGCCLLIWGGGER